MITFIIWNINLVSFLQGLCSSIHVDSSSRFFGVLPWYTTRLIIREMVHIHIWLDWFMCHMTHLNIWQNSYIYDKTHSYMTKLQSFRLLEGEREGEKKNKHRSTLRHKQRHRHTRTHTHTHTRTHAHTHTQTHVQKYVCVSNLHTFKFFTASFHPQKFFSTLRRCNCRAWPRIECLVRNQISFRKRPYGCGLVSTRGLGNWSTWSQQIVAKPWQCKRVRFQISVYPNMYYSVTVV